MLLTSLPDFNLFELFDESLQAVFKTAVINFQQTGKLNNQHINGRFVMSLPVIIPAQKENFWRGCQTVHPNNISDWIPVLCPFLAKIQ